MTPLKFIAIPMQTLPSRFVAMLGALVVMVPAAWGQSQVRDERLPDLELTVRIRGGSGNLVDILSTLEAYGDVEIISTRTIAGAATPSRDRPSFDGRNQGRIFDADAYRRDEDYADRDYSWRRYEPVYRYRDDQYQEGYREGRRDGRLISELELQQYRSAPIYHDAMARGETSMRDGRYSEAARHYLLAAEQYQGDAICRQRAAHALFAAGNYAMATEVLERALDLQPKLMYRDYPAARDFPSQQAFEEKLAELARLTQGPPENTALWALLGYIQFSQGNLEAARTALENAMRVKPTPRFVESLLPLTLASSPAAR